MGKFTANMSFFRWIMLGLVAWALFVAVGTYLGPNFWKSTQYDQQGNPLPRPQATQTFDYRKPLIVIGTAAIFVGGWALLLRSRQRKLARAAAAEHEQSEVSKLAAK